MATFHFRCTMGCLVLQDRVRADPVRLFPHPSGGWKIVQLSNTFAQTVA